MSGGIDALVARLRAHLGPDVALAHCPVDMPGPLLPEEERAMARAVPARRAEFAAGRTAARTAMAAIGHGHAPVIQQANRAPRWPEGLCGSITHHAGHALALVGPCGATGGLGIDLACVSEMTREVAVSVAFGPEAALPPAQVFAAKEATYKALHPLIGTVWPFDAMQIDISDQRFGATLNRPAGPYSTGAILTGHIVQIGDLVLAAIELPPVEPPG